MPTAYITHPSFLLHEMGPYHPECPDRLTAIGDRADQRGARRLSATLFGARGHRASSSGRVHSRDYIAMIEAESPIDRLHFLDPDTAMNPHSLAAARHAAGARRARDRAPCCPANAGTRSVRCVRRAIMRSATGRWGSACSTTSPSALRMRWRTASSAWRSSISTSITATAPRSMFSDDPRVLMVSTFQHPLYPYCGLDNPAPNMVNIPLSAGTGGAGFRKAVTEHWMPAIERHRPEMLFVSAGFDAHREDPLAGLKLVDDDYAWVTREMIGAAARAREGPHRLDAGRRLRALGAGPQRRASTCASSIAA